MLFKSYSGISASIDIYVTNIFPESLILSNVNPIFKVIQF